MYREPLKEVRGLWYINTIPKNLRFAQIVLERYFYSTTCNG